MTSAYDQGQIPTVLLKHRLQIAREHAGYDRDQLAQIMEVSRNTVGNAESGRTHPRKIMLNAWALACGVPVTWLLTGQPPEGWPESISDLRIISAERALHHKLKQEFLRSQVSQSTAHAN